VLLVVAAAAGAVTPFVLRLHEKSHAATAPRAPAKPPPAKAHASPAERAVQPRIFASLVGPLPTARLLAPPVAARAAIVVDTRSGRVLWSRHAHRRVAIASTTKIMTAVLALQRLRPNDVVTVNPLATRVPLVKEGLRPRERVRAWKLFDGLLMYSGNDDALALAIAAAGSRAGFVRLMNEEARALGLADTHFSTPSGVIDSQNYSSAWDLAALTRYALRDARFRRIVRTRIVHVPWSPPTYEKVYVNKNALLGRYRGADGVKTGWTTVAGHCLVASATRHGRTIVAVLLDDRDVYDDARPLLDLGFSTRA
jgi:D-alanyl-D-alanine carboxypeptidase